MVKDLLPGGMSLWMRGNSFKLKYRFRLSITKKKIRVEKQWNRFPRKLHYCTSWTIGNVQDQAGQNFQQHNFVQDVGTDSLQKSLPTQALG